MAQSQDDKSLDLGLLGRLSLSAWETARAAGEEDGDPDFRAIKLQTQKQLQAEIEELNLIVPGLRTQMRIQQQVDESVLLIHGSTGSPADVEDLARHLFENGYTVCSLLLPGHGVDGTALPDVKWKSCLNEVKLRHGILDRLSSRTHVIGFSFGAALALHLAAATRVSDLVLLAPALEPRMPLRHKMVTWLKLHRLPFVRSRVGWDLEVFEAMEKARGLVAKLQVPVYAAHCEDDERIDAASLRFLQRKAKHPDSRFHLFETGGHTILQAHGASGLHDEILDFLRGRARRS